jgi:hypothetical protein
MTRADYRDAVAYTVYSPLYKQFCGHIHGLAQGAISCCLRKRAEDIPNADWAPCEIHLQPLTGNNLDRYLERLKE